MADAAPLKEVFRKDYQPTPYQPEHVDLKFELSDNDKSTIVCKVRYAPKKSDASAVEADLVLHGEAKPAAMELVSVSLNSNPLSADDYCLTEGLLTVPGRMLGSSSFDLEVVTKLDPASNTELSGLYKTGGIFCTQEEAEGFRNMTYFYDRPDCMATYTTTIVAPKQQYPQLLSNGNLVAAGDMEDGRHYAKWEDPWPKPCYLFALVAGDLACVTDEFVTMSGKKVTLRLFVHHGNESQTPHAMASLKRAFKWDEERFGREYDLDLFNVVAVSDFNCGAMENKSLNIFNDRYILADNKTATDDDFSNVLGVVGHEYFHNWTGNRVTCRDWYEKYAGRLPARPAGYIQGCPAICG